MMQALAKAGIIDLSDDFYHRFSYVPDLLCPQRSPDDNLAAAINSGLINILMLHNKFGYRFEAVLYIFATRQGVHIEIPADTIRNVIKQDALVDSETIRAIKKHNLSKLELVQRFYGADKKSEA
jgi:hypothetical protein